MVQDMLLATCMVLVCWMLLHLLIELVIGKQFPTHLNVQLILILIIEGWSCALFRIVSKLLFIILVAPHAQSKSASQIVKYNIWNMYRLLFQWV